MVLDIAVPEIDGLLAKVDKFLHLLEGSHGRRTVSKPHPIPDALLTVREVSAWTRLATGTIYQMTSTRTIPHLKIGGRLLFQRDTVQAWLDSRVVPRTLR